MCKYSASTPKWEQKHWLYEQYWEQLQSLEEVAALVDVSQYTLRRSMESLGIPRRGNHPVSSHQEVVEQWGKAETVDENGRGDEIEWVDCRS